MGVELMMGYRDENFTRKMEESAVQEAASGLESIEKLIKLLSQPPQNQERSSSSSSRLSMAAQMDYQSVADLAVSKFRKVISLLGRTRTGHARFRRAPVQNREPPNFENRVLYPTPIQKIPHQQHDSSVKNCVIEGKDSATTINFSSDSAFQISNFSQVSSAGKPPLSSCSLKRKCSSENLGSGKCGGSSGRCHCCSKKRKQRLKRVVRVPAISLKMSDIPPDDYSWRKYGQKPIKGSPHPRGYYKCSSVRGCPARKHVERAMDDPSMLIVTYEADHNHSISVASESDATNLILESS